MKIDETARPQRIVRREDRQALYAAFQEAGAPLIRTFRFVVMIATAAVARRFLLLCFMTMRFLVVSCGHAGARRPMLHRSRWRERRKSERESHDNREQCAQCGQDEYLHGHHEKIWPGVNSYNPNAHNKALRTTLLSDH
jgi:hypothetical protein